MRISTSQIYSFSLRQMNSALNDVTELNMMNSSQKRINRPSDDPADMGSVMELQSYDQSLSGYVDNCATSGEYLGLADQALVQASENITAARELAEQASTGTYTDEQMRMMALEMDGYLDSLLAIANTQMGTDSVFAGNDLQADAYANGLGVTLPNDSLDDADFVELTGEVDSCIAVEFESSGQVGVDALNYRYSTDGGESWTTATLPAADLTLDLGTCQVELAAGTAITAVDADGNGATCILRRGMVYTGTDEAMTVAISESTDVAMTTVGSALFGGVDQATGQPFDEPNLFETMSDCIAYMETGNQEGVEACLEAMRDAHEQVETGAANIGARESKASYTQQTLSLVREITTGSISRKEDADAAQIVVELEQANYVYEAVLSSSAKIMRMSLMDYL